MIAPDKNRLLALQQLALRFGLSESDLPRIDWNLLHQALIHPSYAADFGSNLDNDRLEFLGDEILRFITAEFLYRAYPSEAVGQLTAVRSVLVSDKVLAEWAAESNLGKALLVSKGTLQEGRGENTRLADGFEAVIGALYLSTGNIDLIVPWLQPKLASLAHKVIADPVKGNYIGALQEQTQKLYQCLPDYLLFGAEPPFTCEVRIQGKLCGVGEGKSKKVAQQVAAQIAFEQLESESS
ncbi:MAG: ribonuclease III [Anaerolineae bacterium]|nr:ribonuclease III [Gloeobacterales cyanobacterium ES-bin-313]